MSSRNQLTGRLPDGSATLWALHGGVASIRNPGSRNFGAHAFSLHFCLGVLAIAISPFVNLEDWWILAPFCLASLIILVRLVLRYLRANPPGILYETGLFLAISCGVYYAFGPMLFVIGPEEAVEHARSWYWVEARESLWLTGINFVGLGLAGITYSIARLSSLSSVAHKAAIGWARLSPGCVFLIFLLVGLVAKYLFVLPYELRLTESVPSGPARQLARLLTVALIIGWLCRRHGPRWLRGLTSILLVEEMLVGFLMFNKTEVLAAVMATGFGDFFVRGRLVRLLSLSLLGLLIYMLTGGAVTFGREELVARGGGVPEPASLSERYEIAQAYFATGRNRQREMDTTGLWWSRLNYLPAQQSAVHLYDQGHGSDALDRLPWIAVPRLLFPNKPEMTVAGIDLTEKVTGFRHSSTGVGVFVDGYYMLGWVGVILVSFTYGLALRAYSVISREVVRNHSVVMYPLVFSGIYAGLRADGWWLTDVVGPFAMTLFMLALFRFFSKS